jgi:alpha-galactosidase
MTKSNTFSRAGGQETIIFWPEGPRIRRDCLITRLAGRARGRSGHVGWLADEDGKWVAPRGRAERGGAVWPGTAFFPDLPRGGDIGIAGHAVSGAVAGAASDRSGRAARGVAARDRGEVGRGRFCYHFGVKRARRRSDGVIKVAMIGAGSVVFSKNLTGDILSYPEFKDATFSYMDIDRDRLEVGANLCRKVAKSLGASPTIEATMDRREALRDADFVINMVQIGGFDSTLVDFEIPRKYGLNFTIADTTGPGGLFRALRTYPMLSGLCREMMQLCPRALLLNYSNPMSMNMQAIYRTSEVRAVGLCHSVQGTLGQIMKYIGLKAEEVAFTCAGINHMAFYLRLEKEGQDLYPRLFEAISDEKIYCSNKVRFELMKRLGYFVTESSEHNAEYNPYFIPWGEDAIKRFDVPIDDYLRRCDANVEEFEQLKRASGNGEGIEVRRSHEYGSTIIHSMVTGKPSVVYGNMPNRGAIRNLPDDAIVEVPTLVDRGGCQFTTVGELPPQLVAYMNPHVSQHELFIRAAMEGKREHVYQAAMFDPLTSAMLTLDQIVEMCDELIAAHGDLLPKLACKTCVPTSGKRFGPVDATELRRQWDQSHAKAR